MLTLKELHDSYNNTHSKYPNPLVYHNMKDKELSMLKYKALRPYLECLEGQIIIYRERFIAFAILSNVEVDEKGFRANVRALDPIFHPPYISNEIDGLKWSMGGIWGCMASNHGRISCLYANWCIWPEKHFVEFIEKIYLEDGRNAAHKAIHQSSK